MSDDYARYAAERAAWIDACDLRAKGWRELGASARVANCLACAEVPADPRDPRLMDDRWLLRIPMFGRKSLRELRELIGAGKNHLPALGEGVEDY